jgi:hypothetical protein
MVNIFYKLTTLCFLLSTLFVSTAQAQEIEASVNRSEIALGETVRLAIRAHGRFQSRQLDLSPITLAEEFNVLGSSMSSQRRNINGVVEQWTDYSIELFPTKEGKLNIPVLDLNGLKTNPITITVLNEGARSNQPNKELFLEIETNKESVYVQEQLLFAIRLYYTINGIRNPYFTELEIEDSLTQLIGSPNQYEEVIDSVRYGIYEIRYIIFPQRSGPLEIPNILFRGEVNNAPSNFIFQTPNTQRVTAFIEGMTIDVKERPSSLQNTDFWLPASRLTLEETWSTDINKLKVGDSVVRTITMSAEGLDGAALPPFTEGLEIEGMNLYPDPPQIDHTFVNGSIVGTRIESTSIVPINSGNIIIPEISIPWWNVDTDQLEATVIPSTRLNIATISGEIPAEQTIASAENLKELLAPPPPPALEQDKIDEQSQAEFIEVDLEAQTTWFSYAIILALIIASFFLYKFFISDNKQKSPGSLQQLKNWVTAKYNPEENEKAAYRQLARACKNNNLTTIRQALIQWCDHYFDEYPVLSMEDIAQQTTSPELHEHVLHLQTNLFQINSTQGDKESFNAKELLSLITQLRKKKLLARKQQQRENQYALPPLYKT